MQIDFIKCQGSGNDFPLIDGRALALDDATWSAIAIALADRAGPVGGDGLLVLVAGNGDAAFGQRMWNPDGSESETCLNGLRCVARLGFEATGLAEARVSLPTSVAQAAIADPLAPGVVTIRTDVGPVSTRTADVGLRIDAPELIDSPIPGLPSERRFTAVAMPNPHLVTFVDTLDEAELVALGDWCEAAPPLIPGRANVSFVTVDDGELFVRTYERGVGLTDSCGSAMGASVFAAGLTGRIGFGAPVTVRNRGGRVVASASQDARIAIAGNASFEYDASVDVDLANATAGPVTLRHRRDDERAAWQQALGTLSD
ncbi:diaminopimelate epimerase [Sphingomonas sp. S1-29]|uniref:diaminopimelate epimerase n=1 Tax=Sphingomonas sp. S1-29 TaxID=2991074 RepID=UPI00223FF8A3|nr:diaminopimelate epimerase [Sphingomonas sp. S1-29]